MIRFKRLLVGAVAAGVTLMVAGPALAAPAATPVGMKQYFAGQVNANSGQSVLSVTGCSPTTTANNDANGTLLPGQTVSVTRFLVPPPTAFGSHLVGYTGSAHKISADLDVAFTDHPLIYQVHIADLSAYATTASFPPGMTVPCNATFTAVFTPINGGAKAVASQVTLTLGNPMIVATATPVVQPPGAYRLAGTGFAPNTRYTVAECSATGWIVPRDPCVGTNSIKVTTSSTGAFTHAFVPAPCSIALLPACYVGVPLPFGVDTVELVGATRIMVL